MSQVRLPPGQLLLERHGSAAAGARPVTCAVPVPTYRRFSHSPRGFARRARPVTSVARPPFLRRPAPAASPCAPGRAPARPRGSLCARRSAAGRVDGAGRPSRRSAGWLPSRDRAGTRRGTCCSAVVLSCSWWSPLDDGRATPLRRLPGLTSAWHPSRALGGSQDGRRQTIRRPSPRTGARATSPAALAAQAAAVRRPKWISRPPLGGSQAGRRQSATA